MFTVSEWRRLRCGTILVCGDGGINVLQLMCSMSYHVCEGETGAEAFFPGDAGLMSPKDTSKLIQHRIID